MIFFNNRGISLVETLATVGIAGGIMVGVNSVVMTSQKEVRSLEIDSQYEELKSSITSSLLKKNSCDANLRGLTAPTNLNQLKANTDTVMLQVGEAYNNALSIDAIELTEQTVMDDNVSVFNLRFSVSPFGSSQRSQFDDIELNIYAITSETDASIAECMNQKHIALLEDCRKTGGSWIHSERKCIYARCAPNEKLQEILPDGSLVCRSTNCDPRQSLVRLNGSTADSVCEEPLTARMCPTGQVLIGISSQGNLDCRTPIHCTGSWSSCSRSCGGGVRVYRHTRTAMYAGRNCSISNGARRSCNTQACPPPPPPPTLADTTGPTQEVIAASPTPPDDIQAACNSSALMSSICATYRANGAEPDFGGVKYWERTALDGTRTEQETHERITEIIIGIQNGTIEQDWDAYRRENEAHGITEEQASKVCGADMDC